jgi:hypothetical protein
MNKRCGFPALLDAIYCMQGRWKNCPATWHGEFKGHKKDFTIIHEAVADHFFLECHVRSWDMDMACIFLGCLVLTMTSMFSNGHLSLANGESTPVEFQAKEWPYNIGYYLGDGIHPKWDIF